MLSRFIIYGLVDPRSKELRYVGKSTSGMKRPTQHTSASYLKKHERIPTTCWVKSLLAGWLKPDIVVLEECDSALALGDAERFHIAFYRMAGCRLTNLTNGGEGGRGSGYHLTVECRAKMAAAHRGMRHTLETRRRISEVQIGKKQTHELVERRISHLRGRERPESVRLAISKTKGGQPIVDQVGVVYASVADAARKLKLNASAVGKCVRGTLSQTGGYRLRRREP